MFQKKTSNSSLKEQSKQFHHWHLILDMKNAIVGERLKGLYHSCMSISAKTNLEEIKLNQKINNEKYLKPLSIQAENQGRIFINPIMAQYYFFFLDKVIKRIEFREFIEDVNSAADVISGVEYYRENLQHKIREEIPRTNQF